MAKLRVEVCLISARGLRRTSSMWRLQWFAVGWINTNDKYCTAVDASGSTNPVWKTKFSMSIDASDSAFQDLALHVEVYSRGPVFLRERLLGTTTVVLKELLDKYYGKSEVLGHVEEVGSFQLRKKNSDKPQGFVDVSIRISEENEECGATYPGGKDMFRPTDRCGGTERATEYGSLQFQRPQLPLTTLQQPGSNQPLLTPPNYSDQASLAGPNYHTPGGGGGGGDGDRPIYHPPPGHRPGHGFATGLGAEALAAGAMIFGDDFLSGFEFSGHLGDAGVSISTDPPL
ncbi:UNVERIFIED_CONTAM: hypothetical protein Scaly_0511300 [Sesamum calycinum]|uniref:C2 domain-containing protein n=1 Tax=Sesamum calycinum TaxID=2727403 RepID=A0AAW2RQ65_9LAMI